MLRVLSTIQSFMRYKPYELSMFFELYTKTTNWSTFPQIYHADVLHRTNQLTQIEHMSAMD